MRDSETFDAFYAGSVRRLVSQLYAMTGDRAEAEDVVQEACARAWQRWDKVSRYGNPEAWVRTVAYRISVSSWRKAVNRGVAHRRDGGWAPAPEVSPDYVAIIAALRKISESQRRAIVLHHLVGLSVTEIAAETGASQGAITFVFQDGRTESDGTYTATLVGGGRLTFTLSSGPALSGSYRSGGFALDGCGTALKYAATYPAFCQFSYQPGASS